LELKTILEPSGDQAGCSSSATLEVRGVCPVPSAFMTQISALPFRSEVKAIFPFAAEVTGKIKHTENTRITIQYLHFFISDTSLYPPSAIK
jgi:hypothetical protein